jgi:ribosomal protein S18 acetylase RimI-like enzyme
VHPDRKTGGIRGRVRAIVTCVSTRDELEAYYDEAPRARCDVEEIGPFTLFVARSGWSYYARPRLGLDTEVTKEDLSSVLERQRQLGVPRSIEWVDETTPSLLPLAEVAGMEIERFPLLVLDGPPVSRDAPVDLRLLGPDDPELGPVRAAVSLGFAHLGTQRGEVGVAERDERVALGTERLDWLSDVLASGLSVLAGAFDPVAGAVGGGSHNPRGPITEIVGVGVLPAFRRRGIAGALTALLARSALADGVSTVFCSAEDEDVARLYESIGFRRVGLACTAEAP